MSNKIKEKKKELAEQVKQKNGKFLDKEVRKISQELDELIVEYMKSNNEKLKSFL